MNHTTGFGLFVSSIFKKKNQPGIYHKHHWLLQNQVELNQQMELWFLTLMFLLPTLSLLTLLCHQKGLIPEGYHEQLQQIHNLRLPPCFSSKNSLYKTLFAIQKIIRFSTRIF